MTPFREDTSAFENAPLMLGASRSAVVLTLAYFSLFKHPLREAELLEFIHFFAISPEEGRAAISDLVNRGILESSEGVIFLKGDSELAGVRTERERRAEEWRPRVSRSIKSLSCLPFIRGLFISGSLSKGTQDLNGDIDFLVVTAPNRLWTVQFFATLLMKLLPASLRRCYCVNYFLSQDQLTIPDRTLFSATEIAFLKPVMGREVCTRFFEQNTWIRAFYPNRSVPEGPVLDSKASTFQRMLEWPLSGTLGDHFEAWISRLFFKRIEKYLDGLPPGRNRDDFRAGPTEFKGHVRGRHDSTRLAWYERTHQLEDELGIRLVRWPWAMPEGHGKVPSGLANTNERHARRVIPLSIKGRRPQPPR